MLLLRSISEDRRKAMKDHGHLEELEKLARNSKSKGHGARLRRALLVLAIPATAALATACYGVPMAELPHDVTYGDPIHLDGVDCDGDGVIDVAQLDHCPVVVSMVKN